MGNTETKKVSRKEKVGKVVSNKMNKTIVVEVSRRHAHPQFKKVVITKKKFYAHDEKEVAQMGDTVCIEETRPLSKDKYFRLVRIVEKAK